MNETINQDDTKNLWKLPNWRKFWGATAISTLGDVIFDVTAILWVSTVLTKGTSWGPMAVSGLVMCSVVPMLLFGTIGGALADRFSPRASMVVCNIIQCSLITTIIPLAFVYEAIPMAVALAWIYAAVGLSNMAGVVFNAARMKMMSAAIPQHHWTQGSSLLQGTVGVISIVGPPLAAPLLFSTGPWLAFALNAVSFAVSSLCLVGVALADSTTKAAGKQQSSLAEDVLEGMRFVAGHPLLRALVISLFAVTLGTAPINSLQVYFVPENLNAPAENVGFLSGSFGAGAMIGAFASGVVAKRISVARLFVLVITVVGVTLVGYSRVDSLVVGCVVLAFAGCLVGSLNTALSPLVMSHTPSHMLGRVMGVINPIQQAASLIAIGVAGLAASALTVNFTMQWGPILFKRTDLVFGVCGILIVLAIAVTGRPILAASKNTTTARDNATATPSGG